MKLFLKVSLLGLFSVGIFALFLFTTRPVEASAPDTIVGAAWSSNIGWISMNNCDAVGTCSGVGYGVTMPASGTVRNITGYAWSSNIGWISFNADASTDSIRVDNCPKKTTQGTCQAYADWPSPTGTVRLHGWARACSVFVSGCTGQLNDDELLGGWDGFIALGDTNTSDSIPYGVTINPTTGVMSACSAGSGCAWGSNVIGWVDFSKVKIKTVTVDPSAPVVTLTANPAIGNVNVVNPTLTWTTTNSPTTCTATGDWSGSKAVGGGNEVRGILNTIKVYSYTLSCTNAFGTGTATTTVVVEAVPGIPPSGNLPPTVTLIASPNPVPLSASTKTLLTWTNITKATECHTGVGPWGTSGNKAINAGAGSTEWSQSLGGTTQFTITCTGPGGQATASVTVDLEKVTTGSLCSNIPGIVAPLPTQYVRLPSGRCGCAQLGYILNTTTLQCTKPIYKDL